VGIRYSYPLLSPSLSNGFPSVVYHRTLLAIWYTLYETRVTISTQHTADRLYSGTLRTID
jgi:hypothetical protein